MPKTFETFKSVALAEGFDEVLEREWAPNTGLEEHSHPYAVKALVVRGEMWLTVGGETQHLVPGDLFEIERSEPHSERYGAEGGDLLGRPSELRPTCSAAERIAAPGGG